MNDDNELRIRVVTDTQPSTDQIIDSWARDSDKQGVGPGHPPPEPVHITKEQLRGIFDVPKPKPAEPPPEPVRTASASQVLDATAANMREASESSKEAARLQKEAARLGIDVQELMAEQLHRAAATAHDPDVPDDYRVQRKATWTGFMDGFRQDMEPGPRHWFDARYKEEYKQAGGSYRQVLGGFAGAMGERFVGKTPISFLQGISKFRRERRNAKYFAKIGHGSMARVSNLKALGGLATAALAATSAIGGAVEGIKQLGVAAMQTAEQVGRHSPQIASQMAIENVQDIMADIEFAQSRASQMASLVDVVRDARRDATQAFREAQVAAGPLVELLYALGATAANIFTLVAQFATPLTEGMKAITDWLRARGMIKKAEMPAQEFLKGMESFLVGDQANMPFAGPNPHQPQAGWEQFFGVRIGEARRAEQGL